MAPPPATLPVLSRHEPEISEQQEALSRSLHYKYGSLTKLVQSRGLDIGRVLVCVFMDRDGIKVHKHAKKERGQLSSPLDRTSLVNKGFIVWPLGKFFLRDKAGSPERAR